MNSKLEKDGQVFEDEVRRIARRLWPDAQYDGATVHHDRERDAIFFTEDIIHCIECTTSPRKDKAETDLSKLHKLVIELRRAYPDQAVKGWFITKDEPTAEQRLTAKQYRGMINILSFDQFRAKLIDAHSYLRDREKYPFGSVKSLDDNTIEVSRNESIPIDLLEVSARKTVSVQSIADKVRRGQGRFLITGDFGVGKSMTLRELYYRARDNFKKNDSRLFPVFVNLRDHEAQQDSAEALERHGRNVGFNRPSDLLTVA